MTNLTSTTRARWNPAGKFGALYLNATIAVAASNTWEAHRAHWRVWHHDQMPKRLQQHSPAKNVHSLKDFLLVAETCYKFADWYLDPVPG